MAKLQIEPKAEKGLDLMALAAFLGLLLFWVAVGTAIWRLF
jgi:hypothetical protein